MTGTYRIGGALVEIHSLYEAVHELCQKYCEAGKPDLVVSIKRKDIMDEQKRSLQNAAREGKEQILYGDAYLEELAVYRKIAEWMPSRKTFLFHGSAIAVDGEGYLFTAKSGTGKSTHTRLWREMLGERAMMINDDKPLIRLEGNRPVVYGTPWDGKHRLSNNIYVPLRGICILSRGRVNRIEAVTREQVYALLVQQMYRPENPEALAMSLGLLSRMRVSYYQLECNMDPEAARISYEAMSGRKAK